MKVKTCPITEAIAKKLISIDSVPVGERAKMIKRAAKAGAEAVKAPIERQKELLVYIAKVVQELRSSGVPLLVPWQERDINKLIKALDKEQAK